MAIKKTTEIELQLKANTGVLDIIQDKIRKLDDASISLNSDIRELYRLKSSAKKGFLDTDLRLSDELHLKLKQLTDDYKQLIKQKNNAPRGKKTEYNNDITTTQAKIEALLTKEINKQKKAIDLNRIAIRDRERSMKLAENQIKSQIKSNLRLKNSLKEVSSYYKINDLVRHLRQIETLVVAYYSFSTAIEHTIGLGLRFNKEMEDMGIKLKAIIATTADNYTLENGIKTPLAIAEKWKIAGVVADRLKYRLREINAETPTTLLETSKILSAISPQALKAGASIKELGDLTKGFSIALTTGNLTIKEAVTALDNVISGEAKNGELVNYLKTLGISMKELKNAKGHEAIDILITKLKELNPITKDFENSMTGILARLKNTYENLMGSMTKSIFMIFKNDLKSLDNYLKENKNNISAWGKTLITLTGELFNKLSPMFKFMKTSFSEVAKGLIGSLDGVIRIINLLIPSIENIVTKLKWFISTLGITRETLNNVSIEFSHLLGAIIAFKIIKSVTGNFIGLLKVLYRFSAMGIIFNPILSALGILRVSSVATGTTMATSLETGAKAGVIGASGWLASLNLKLQALMKNWKWLLSLGGIATGTIALGALAIGKNFDNANDSSGKIYDSNLKELQEKLKTLKEIQTDIKNGDKSTKYNESTIANVIKRTENRINNVVSGKVKLKEIDSKISNNNNQMFKSLKDKIKDTFDVSLKNVKKQQDEIDKLLSKSLSKELHFTPNKNETDIKKATKLKTDSVKNYLNAKRMYLKAIGDVKGLFDLNLAEKIKEMKKGGLNSDQINEAVEALKKQFTDSNEKSFYGAIGDKQKLFEKSVESTINKFEKLGYKGKDLSKVYDNLWKKFNKKGTKAIDSLSKKIKNIFKNGLDSLISTFGKSGKLDLKTFVTGLFDNTIDALKNSNDIITKGIGYGIDVGRGIATALTSKTIKLNINNANDESMLKLQENLNNMIKPHLHYTLEIAKNTRNLQTAFNNIASLNDFRNITGVNFENTTKSFSGSAWLSLLNPSSLLTLTTSQKTKLKDSGIEFSKQTIESFVNGVDAKQFQLTTKTKDHLFGLWSNSKDSLNKTNLSHEISNELSKAMENSLDIVKKSAEKFNNIDVNKFNNYEIDLGTLSFKDKNKDEIVEYLNKVYGKAIDKMLIDLMPNLNEFQIKNEELLNTLTRVPSAIEKANSVLSKYSLQRITQDEIIYKKSADLASEAVKESIIKSVIGNDFYSDIKVKNISFNGIHDTVIKYYDESKRNAEIAKNGTLNYINSLQGSGEDITKAYDDINKYMSNYKFMGGNKDFSAELVNVAGGTDNLLNIQHAYMDKYYTSTEITKSKIKLLNNELGKLNLTLPNTLNGFKNLVENSKNIDTETYVKLMKLSVDAYDILAKKERKLLDDRKKALDDELRLVKQTRDVLFGSKALSNEYKLNYARDIFYSDVRYGTKENTINSAKKYIDYIDTQHGYKAYLEEQYVNNSLSKMFGDGVQVQNVADIELRKQNKELIKKVSEMDKKLEQLNRLTEDNKTGIY